ncbi:hypothetical protein HNP84_009464 [Thermocatellispora tengchongensis]|uniref:DUF4157 domain-containing protein n=1 Tax=Thermocatellispora tengchongensis TaxID=1073253 RepID=A0A840PPN6_9ACTN|nr:hypothetical protein [Thermocatellispora tengchongensis]MBB5139700.1 hypothetical protein [Thermocatellispora tengchongensis]
MPPVRRRLALSGLLAVAAGAALTGAAPPAAPPAGIVVYGVHARVTGAAGVPRARLAEIAAVADRAHDTVAEVWGAVPVLVEVPATREQATRLAGTPALWGLAAVATADRVVIVPDGFSRLSAAGRQVVLTHELTHVATGAATGTGLPLWLTEGFADYVGYRDSGIPLPTAAAELAAEVRAGVLPGSLPADGDFRAGAARLPQAYEAAWLACHYIARRYGEDALVRLYREALRRGVPAALGTLGLTTATLTARWRVYVRAALGRAG